MSRATVAPRTCANRQHIGKFGKTAQKPADFHFANHRGVKQWLVEDSTCGIENGHLGMRMQQVGDTAGDR
jgi:hypothetical protein